MDNIVDVLIIGSGVAGLYCALNLRKDLNILVVSKGKLERSNTYLAQGGIATARNEEDKPFFVQDTLRAGHYKNDIKAVEILADESMENIDELIGLGVEFDKEGKDLSFTKEGAHSINRIVHTKDYTGKSVAQALIKEALVRDNIRIFEDSYFVDIIEGKGKCTGAIVIKENMQINIYAKAVVLATGGIGGLFNNSTNQRILKGDGIATAIKHKIKLKDIDYIQIHPTAFYEENVDDKRLLISEAIRGEGGKLINSKGERFVDEILPRDVVSKAIFSEMKKDGRPYVNLDIRFLGEEYIKNRFSFIYRECLKKGTDITKDYIKVSPAQHYFMGGIEVDVDSKTSMRNLYAVGEVSCTGVHGANRLASTSLLEGLVFSKRAAIDINNIIDYNKVKTVRVSNLNESIEELSIRNERMVIGALRERCKDLDYELFNCR